MIFFRVCGSVWRALHEAASTCQQVLVLAGAACVGRFGLLSSLCSFWMDSTGSDAV